jgi:hypothetical protein
MRPSRVVPGVPLHDFYTSTAQACFLVLSGWWVILSLHFKQWMGDPLRRLLVFDVSLTFLLPGLMSIVSLLAVGVPAMWRVAFAVAGTAGAVKAVVLWRRRAQHGPAGVFVACASWASLTVFSLIAAVALRPSLVAQAGVDLTPLAVEGTLVSCLLVLGFALAFRMFMTTVHEHARPEPASEPRSTRPAPPRSPRWWRTSGAWELAADSPRDG